MNEECQQWLEFARRDVQSAQVLLESDLYPAVCFHAQQAVEKTLKAVLANREQRIARTHSIAQLLKMVGSNVLDDLSDLIASLAELDDVYSSTRYPDVILGSLPDGLPNQQDAEEACATAQTVFERVSRMIE